MVTLTVLSMSSSPQLLVTASDNVGIPATTTVTLEVDLNNDGTFTDPGETGYETATMTNGIAVFTLSPALSVGTVRLRARVTDRAGNQGTSAVSTLLVQATGTGWALTDTTPQIDPLPGDAQLQRGNLTLTHSLDPDRSPGTSVSGDPSLVYNSERAGAEPMIQATVQSDNSVVLPSTLTAQLTWNGTEQTAQTFNRSAPAGCQTAQQGHAASRFGRVAVANTMNTAEKSPSRDRFGGMKTRQTNWFCGVSVQRGQRDSPPGWTACTPLPGAGRSRPSFAAKKASAGNSRCPH